MKIFEEMTVGDVTTWKELTIGVRQLVGLIFDNNFMNPGLFFNRWYADVLVKKVHYECISGSFRWYFDN